MSNTGFSRVKTIASFSATIKDVLLSDSYNINPIYPIKNKKKTHTWAGSLVRRLLQLHIPRLLHLRNLGKVPPANNHHTGIDGFMEMVCTCLCIPTIYDKKTGIVHYWVHFSIHGGFDCLNCLDCMPHVE